MSNNTYTLLANGWIASADGRTIYPPSKSNFAAAQVIDELISLGLASEERSGLVAFKPDEKILKTEVRAEIKVKKSKTTSTKGTK